MKIIYFFIIFIIFFISSCSKIRDSAGVNRKSIDEFIVVENPPLIIPPDFNLLPPNQLKEKNIEIIESELAKEILFGLDKDEIYIEKQANTMNQILLKTEAYDVSDSIRNEINEEFAQEINTNNIFNNDFKDKLEVLDAVKESERIRKNNFEGESISEGDIPIKNKNIKKKKKKRFFFF